MRMKKSELDALKIKLAQKHIVTKTITKDIRKSAGDPNIEVVTENASLIRWVRGITWGRWDGSEVEKGMYDKQVVLSKALGQDDATRGGLFVPDTIRDTIIPKLRATAAVRNMPGVSVTTITGTKEKIPFEDGEPVATWDGENTTISEDTTMSWGQRTLETHRLSCLYIGSREVFENARINLEDQVRTRVIAVMGNTEDTALLEGLGGTQPLGFYRDPGVHVTDLSATITFDSILNAALQVENSNSQVTGWVTNPTVKNTLSKLKDAEGRYLNLLVKTAGGYEFDGLPIKLTTNVPTTLRPSSNESYMVGGRWTDYTIVENPGIVVETTTEGGDTFAKHQLGIKFIRYVGSLILQPDSFVLIKGIQR
jgi:HK97 family phage major capsid protein